MSEVSLRPMTLDDLDAVVALDVEAFGEEAWSRQMLAGELGQQPVSRYYLVALCEDAVVGYGGLMAARGGEQADVVTLAVAAAWQGQGLGSALLAELLAEAVRRGCREVVLEVRADNERAQRLYRGWDFTEVGVRPAYYQPSGTDAIVMRRDLAPPGPAPAGEIT